METQCAGNGGGGEVRRIHVIYFLSRKGRIEHPHLIRVHHFSRNGVHLCDVKRWLSELRGKEMPESYSWSYKRRYKSGFVWQDLLDDNLITPISDNEYVLKGSEIPSINFDENKVVLQKDSIVEKNEKDQKPSCNDETPETKETKRSDSMKTTSEIEEESIVFGSGSDTSTLTDDSMKSEEENLSNTNKQEKTEKSDTSKDSSLLQYSNIFSKSETKKSGFDKINNTENQRKPAPAMSSPSFTKSKSTSSGKPSIFRNLINCGAVETNDAAVIPMKKCENGSCTLPNRSKTGELRKGDKLGGSQKIFGTCWNQQQQETLPNNGRRSCDGRRSSSSVKSDSNKQKPVPAAYKPVNKPNCSQCKKTFRPEKMHAHMKSCRGMKPLGKVSGSGSASAMDFEPRRASASSCKDPTYSYFLKY